MKHAGIISHIFSVYFNIYTIQWGFVLQVLLGMLPAYYNHVRAFENTLVTKFFGLHCVKMTGPAQKKVYETTRTMSSSIVFDKFLLLLHHVCLSFSFNQVCP